MTKLYPCALNFESAEEAFAYGDTLVENLGYRIVVEKRYDSQRRKDMFDVFSVGDEEG